MRKCVDIVSIVFVGHLGAHYLSAAGLATTTANVTGNSMVIGLAGALTTICSQAFGSKDMNTLSLAVQRAIIILMVCLCLPVSILWIFSASIMEFLGQQHEIAVDAGRYLIVLIPGLWAYSCSICMTNWLHSQSKTAGIAYITLFVSILHPLWCYLLVIRAGYGFLGAAMSASISKILEFLLLLVFINFFSTVLQETQFSFQPSRWFSGWWPFLKIGFPNIMMMTEWWASEIIIFLSGSLPSPEVQVSAMSIYQNTLSICFMFPTGFHVAGSTRVGNAIGEGRADVAFRASVLSPLLAALISSFVSLTLYVEDRNYNSLFTSDERVLDCLSSLLPIIALYLVGDGVQTALTGIVKGMGKQKAGGPIVLFSYYAIAIPLSVYLTFPIRIPSFLSSSLGLGGGDHPVRVGHRWGIFGLCLGTLVGTYAHMLLFMVVVYLRTDWAREIQSTQASRERRKLKLDRTARIKEVYRKMNEKLKNESADTEESEEFSEFEEEEEEEDNVPSEVQERWEEVSFLSSSSSSPIDSESPPVTSTYHSPSQPSNPPSPLLNPRGPRHKPLRSPSPMASLIHSLIPTFLRPTPQDKQGGEYELVRTVTMDSFALDEEI